MKTMAIEEFKTKASRAVSRVASSKEGIIITKRGKPLAQVLPYASPDLTPVPGLLADTLVFEGDILSPFPSDMWEANR